ncbi:cell fate regulator YaaT (PSP1 superfamily) [Nonlabens dokdonensis]|uniref:PSP1 domain protein n=2 Tax=Nonlabens dokdonensis TaxID=328515 RepID=L7WBY2_NONDD|nr:regulatory iron-sulfur-containing complex subunit RicT [Nonlabens dokdonensis]AGC76378.1 PSP1 domain protein [Nonlabens dokdonensis DSW-6]PZX44036.1 cell fate regulator YaaT (PSP1 superfamily) [Nonlabens dokdonensis]
MSCNSCGTGGSTPGGCKNNGTCGTSGCNKLTVFDWLANMELPDGQKKFPYVEVRFKNSRKEFFFNKEDLQLKIGDIVATQTETGHDVGIVTITGELVRVQMKRKRVKISEEIPQVYRIANAKDVEKWVAAREKEEPMKVRAREIAIRLQLKMKISDIEFQGDGSKATFYYTADERVDFRELIREYASEFKTRIEMRQIGLRQEAARLGGIGSCGRELCCSTWLTDFRSVTTGAARYQNLSLNPQKLAGQCGKLKCCLNYELDSYMDALSTFPKQNQKLYTDKGTAVCQKVDIFKGLMWYCYEGDWMSWHTLTTEQVHEIVAKNKAKEKVASIEEYASELIIEEKVDFENVVGQDSLTRFDQPKSRKKRSNKKRRPSAKKGNSTTATATQNAPAKKETPPKGKTRPNKRRNTKNKTGAQPASKSNDKSKPANNPATKSNKPRPKRNKNNNRNKPPKKEE